MAAASALLVAFASCSSTKTAVGEGLLTDIIGQVSRRDTIDLTLPTSPVLTCANFPMGISHSSSEVLLIGEANNLRATTLLKFAPLTSWTEEQYYSSPSGSTALTDTLTITPTAIATDSAAELRATFVAFVADSNTVTLRSQKTATGWSQADSATAALPAFTGPLLADVSLDSTYSGAVVDVPIPSAELSVLMSDSLSLAMQGAPGSPMIQIVSRDGVLTYSPQIVVWITAQVTSKRPDVAQRDTVVGLSLSPVEDCHRLERLAPPPTPAPDAMLLAAGAPRRGYVRFNRFDIPGLSDSNGVVPARTTVNSALLELTLGTGGYSFQRDAAHVELYPLGEAFDLDSAQVSRSALIVGRVTSAGFNTVESTSSTVEVRRFEIADLVNDWWHDTTSNYGLLLKLSNEDRCADAVEVRGVRLILVTTTPPIIAEKPARRDPAGEEGR